MSSPMRFSAALATSLRAVDAKGVRTPAPLLEPLEDASESH